MLQACREVHHGPHRKGQGQPRAAAGDRPGSTARSRQHNTAVATADKMGLLRAKTKVSDMHLWSMLHTLPVQRCPKLKNAVSGNASSDIDTASSKPWLPAANHSVAVQLMLGSRIDFESRCATEHFAHSTISLSFSALAGNPRLTLAELAFAQSPCYIREVECEGPTTPPRSAKANAAVRETAGKRNKYPNHCCKWLSPPSAIMQSFVETGACVIMRLRATQPFRFCRRRRMLSTQKDASRKATKQVCRKPQVVPPTTTAGLVTCVCENKKIVQVMKRGRQKSRNKCLCSHYRAAVSTFHKEPDPRAGGFGIPCSNETLGGEPPSTN